MKRDMKDDQHDRRYSDLQAVAFGGVFVAAVLAGSVNMLGGGWVWASLVFAGVVWCSVLLGKRIERHYDRIRGGNGQHRDEGHTS